MVDGETINKSKEIIQQEIQDIGYLQDGGGYPARKMQAGIREAFIAASSVILVKLNFIS